MPETELITAPTSPTAPARRASTTPDWSSPDLYLNRELTWIAFNRRVLAEAANTANPLLERVKFLAITASNLDEFFMKRIGGLKQQVAAGLRGRSVDGLTPREQINACIASVLDFEREQRLVLTDVLAAAAENGIGLVPFDALSQSQRALLREHYVGNVFPLVTPQVLDPAHPFPLISNLSLNLLVSGRQPDTNDPFIARIKVPIGFGIARLVRLENSRSFVLLEDIIANNLDLLFPDVPIDRCELFRVIRNANTERDEDDADDLLELIETELRDRRIAPIVRLEVAEGMEPLRRGMLAAELGLDERTEVVEVRGTLGLRDLMQLATIDDSELHDAPLHAVDHPQLPESRNIFHSIRDAGSVLLLHPYESFVTSVQRFLADASADPRVRAIKMTLYRTSPDAAIIDCLLEAARNGKQVAVVIELKARFDEAANIAFAEKLEDYGIHVSYGVLGYKTHCKVILVVRQDYDGLRRYAHIGTGNYHSGTARLYADFGLLTVDPAIGQDLSELFNFLTTGIQPRRRYRKLIPAPVLLKEDLIARIAREARHGSNGYIQLKMNALEDRDITEALYRASQGGVRVDLIIRDTCRLRPGLAGISECVRVVSIVGRFLEHGRIYYFRNGGEEEYFIGSADSMKRNLESRIEVLVPIAHEAGRRQLRALLDLQLAPNRNSWTMHSDGGYTRTSSGNAPDCQSEALRLVERVESMIQTSGTKRRQRYARRPAHSPGAD